MQKRKNKSNYTLLAGFILLLTTILGVPEPGALFAQEAVRSEAVGKLAGTVRLEGLFERPAPLKVYKNRDFCETKVLDQTLLISRDGGVQNVVITVRGFRHEPIESAAKQIVLDNKNCAFAPHVQVASLGSEVLLLNSDPILHNVHARIGTETLFNVGLPKWRRVKKRLEREGVIRINCDVLHTWMSAYIVVTSSPYFAVTDRRGEFVIKGVPAGTYEIEAWHEKLGIQSSRVAVTKEIIPRVDFVYRIR